MFAARIRKIIAAYESFVIHHIPREAVRPLIEELCASLLPGGRLIVKDVDDRPVYKR